MDRETFINGLTNASSMDRSKIDRVLTDSIDSNMPDGNPRGHRNLIIVMEELAELSKEISKELRGKGDTVSILEEMADVQLGIYYIQKILCIDDNMLEKAVAVKTNRLASVLYTDGSYK